ncbi:tigger transposable element-derived protein 6-like isoform X2 [Nilaparvata lugens]|uniref:tigger transposable element-derived protein 6-like isoform X2 n=1 Tax=Nilaparvata lugens TaxID=108931 RepID=UPI00193CA6F7|nr:tigger transposable element-derived protein 6-like isoform X2 [Nilaparvata lugens]
MARPKKKGPKFEYSEADMDAAIAAVREGETAFAVSRRFGVPRSTLVNKATGKTPIQRKMGPPPALGHTIEEMIAKWIRAMASRGFTVTKIDLAISVKQIVTKMNIKTNFTNNTPGKKWIELFLNRHPNIVLRETEKLSKVRASVTEKDIRAWFAEVQDYVREKDLCEVLKDPTQIFNLDETGFMLCPNTGKVLAAKGQKNIYEVHSGSGKENITVLTTVNAAGKSAPTLVLYPGLPSAIKTSFPANKDWALGRSESGWMNGEVFFEFIANNLHNWLKEQKIKMPIILFMDGYSAHLTYHLSKFCADHEIVLIALPPNGGG